MRIIIDIDEARNDKNQTVTRIRTKYYQNGDDKLRTRNAGVEIYNLIKEGFGSSFEGGIIIHNGEQK